MDIDTSQCPEDSNSTDCLLRTLLQLLKEYREADSAAIDWDPISFAFTLLIGLVAILFALATVIQAIFAAGKGHRRTNHLAIGKWNVETKREWDWSEMNFRYIVTTPILHEDSLQSLADYDKVKHSSDKNKTGKAVQKAERKLRGSIKSIASCFHPYQHSSSEPKPNQSRHPSAAWLEFFKEVGLAGSDVKAWGTYTRKVVADYLPDDITAAPAYAQVGAIVAAAVTAGIQKLDIDKHASRNYPIIFGQGFQIDFRQHPALGVVGAYSRYDETSKESRSLNVEEVRSTIKTGRGFVDGQATMDVSTESTRRSLIEKWSQLAVAHALTCESWSATFALNSSAVSEAHLPLIIGMFADRPRYVPALFPTATMRNNNCITALALNGKYWAEMHLRRPEISSRYEQVDTPTWNGFFWARVTDWESPGTMTSEVQELFDKLKIFNVGRSVSMSPWGQDIIMGHTGELMAALKSVRPGGEEPATGSKTQLEEEIAPAEPSTTNLESEGKGHGAEAEAMKASARKVVTSEARLPIEKTDPNSDTSVGEPTVSQQDTKAKAKIKATVGQFWVLERCLELLHEPALLEQWFSEASSDTLRFLRTLLREQIKDVDEWLRHKLLEKEGIRHRSILLCNTTIVLLQVEQMISNDFFNSTDPEESRGRGVRGRSVEHKQMHSSNQERPEQVIVSTTRLSTLQVLRNIVDSLHGKVRGASELEKLLHRRSDSNLLWDRLKALVVYHSEDEPGWRLWTQFKHEKHDDAARDIDDVIIYRCLMMIILFRTAADSSKILESGIWDQVVPII